MRLILSAILGGAILFIWTALSWMALPLHKSTINNFNNPDVVANTIQANVQQSGIYVLMSTLEQEAKGPLVFASVYKGGMQTMLPNMIIEFVTLVIAAFLVSWMLSLTRGLHYFSRVGFVLLFAIAAWLVTDVPNWNWFHFSVNYTLVAIIDLLIGWFLAGLVIAALIKRY